jgi:hypothetical protein
MNCKPEKRFIILRMNLGEIKLEENQRMRVTRPVIRSAPGPGFFKCN